MAEAKAKDDCEAALLAASLIGPLKRFADAAEERARAAEFKAVQLRGKANVHKRFDIRELVRGQTPFVAARGAGGGDPEAAEQG